MWQEVGTINNNSVAEQVTEERGLAGQNGGVILIVREGEMKALLSTRSRCKRSRTVGLEVVLVLYKP